jgi:hypothetical protein
VVLQGARVHLWHDERHLGVEPEVAAVVYDDRAPAYGLLRELYSRALLTLRPGEEGEVNALECLWLCNPYLEGLPREDGPAGAA